MNPTTPSTTPQLGDEMPAPDGRTLRVVRITEETQEFRGACSICALYHDRLGLCRSPGGPGLDLHSFDCARLPEDCIAVFVDDIPVLAVKGILV